MEADYFWKLVSINATSGESQDFYVQKPKLKLNAFYSTMPAEFMDCVSNQMVVGMNCLRFVATVIVLFSATPIILHGQIKAQVRNVAGTYESCLMGCTVIKIRPDFTFSYQPMSDVGEPQVVQGTWKFEESNIIVANTFEQPNKYPFAVKLNPDQKGFTVRIVDKKGMPIQWAEVHMPNENGMLISETNKDGIAEFPRCDPRAMTVKQPFSNYVNSSAVFEFPDKDFNYVEAKIDFIPLFITDQRWLIQNGKLYFVDSYPINKVK